MKRPILLTVLTVLLSGCVNQKVKESYEAYQNTIGYEYGLYLKTGKKWDGEKFTKREMLARELNLKAAKAVIKELNK